MFTYYFYRETIADVIDKKLDDTKTFTESLSVSALQTIADKDPASFEKCKYSNILGPFPQDCNI